MAEILVKATDHTHPDPQKDRRGAYKRGYPVVVMPDGHKWGRKERLPLFVVLRLPGVSVQKMRKYLEPTYTPEVDPDGIPIGNIYRRRQWQLRWEDLPQTAKDRLKADGELTIKATDAYDGSYDYTWREVKGYMHNIDGGYDETAELS